MRRLLGSLLAIAVVVPTAGVAGVGAVVPAPPPPLDEISGDALGSVLAPVSSDGATATGDLPTSVCDPMNDSEVALEIAWIQHEIELLKARQAALRDAVVAARGQTKAFYYLTLSTWADLKRWDRMLEQYLTGPEWEYVLDAKGQRIIDLSDPRGFPYKTKVTNFHPIDILGPREPIFEAWMSAVRNHRMMKAVLEEMLAELRDLAAAIALAEMRLAELEAERFATCHGQPLPPLPPVLLH